MTSNNIVMCIMCTHGQHVNHRPSNRKRIRARHSTLIALTFLTTQTSSFLHPSQSNNIQNIQLRTSSLHVASSPFPTIIPSTTKHGINYSHLNQEEYISPPLTILPDEFEKKIASFSSNISRLRVKKKRIAVLAITDNQTEQVVKSAAEEKQVEDSLINACNSFIYFLNNEALKLSTADDISASIDNNTIATMREILEVSFVQSIRAASEVGDFVLVRKIIQAAVDYAYAFVQYNKRMDSLAMHQMALLRPRIFGEALSSLVKTKASVSKIKGLWNYFIKDVASDVEGQENSLSSVLTSPPSAYELNAMLSTLGSRGKIRAAIKLYRQFAVKENEERTNMIEADAYTASALFGVLADSIALTGDNRAWSNNTTRGEIGVDLGESSPCWQWNEAMRLLDTFSPNQLNNVAYASLLKINEKATEFYDKQALKHSSVPSVMIVLDRMKQDGISPDVVTCSVIMSTFDKGRHWKAAVSFLDAMQESSSRSDITNKWALPPPNIVTYALAISTCARCDKSDAVLSLFDQMASLRAQDLEETVITPYTWVYNKALSACVESCHLTSRSGRGIHLATAMSILEKMEDETTNKNSAPNGDSYNSVLVMLSQRMLSDAKKTKPKSTHQSSRRLSEFDVNSELVFDILDEMKKRRIKWDAVTYSNAISACFSQPQEIIRLFQMSVELERKADILKVANSALGAAAALGDIPLISEVISLLSQANVQINLESIRLIIMAFGKSRDCDAILALLICLRGQDFANDLLKDGHGIDILSNLPNKSIPVLDERIYSAAITSCLKNDELAIADQILQSMKIKGISLNQGSLEDIIMEYCRMAMESSKEEYKAARIAKQNEPGSKYPDLLEPIYFTSSARSKAALALVKAVNKPSFYLLSTVAKACAASGLWQESRSILRRMHRSAVRELKEGSASTNFQGKFITGLPKLHRYLLKFCAKSGHITPALNYADDIQYLAQTVRLHRKSFSDVKHNSTSSSLVSISSILLSDTHKTKTKQQSGLTRRSAPPILRRPIGLTGIDWTLLLTAAWRGGHWKVCVGTLPYLSPYVKETHPKHSRELSKEEDDIGLRRPSLKTLDRKYSQLESAITAAVLCFEIRSQYAWAIRAIEDWMEWSGRRPPRQSVIAACRVLAKRYRGTEILNLVSKVISIQDVHNESVSVDPSEYTYEKAIYTESINALHRSGLYDDADHLYAEGSRSGYLPSAVIESSSTTELTLDLHGMGSPVAHSAVRVSIQNEMAYIQSSNQSQGEKLWTKDVIIITGQGLRSEEKLKPVLRPEVQRMLTEEFFPPIGSSTVHGNLGALRLQRDDIAAWLNNQQQQKGERLLMIADALRGISSGTRIERAIMSSGNRLEQALIRKMQSEKQNDEKTP